MENFCDNHLNNVKFSYLSLYVGHQNQLVGQKLAHWRAWELYPAATGFLWKRSIQTSCSENSLDDRLIKVLFFTVFTFTSPVSTNSSQICLQYGYEGSALSSALVEQGLLSFLSIHFLFGLLSLPKVNNWK